METANTTYALDAYASGASMTYRYINYESKENLTKFLALLRQHKNVKEIAEAMGWSIRTVHRRIDVMLETFSFAENKPR